MLYAPEVGMLYSTVKSPIFSNAAELESLLHWAQSSLTEPQYNSRSSNLAMKVAVRPEGSAMPLRELPNSSLHVILSVLQFTLSSKLVFCEAPNLY